MVQVGMGNVMVRVAVGVWVELRVRVHGQGLV